MALLDIPIVSPVIVGRTREIERLDQALHAAQNGSGQCLCLAGEAGIGKSRLLAELRQRAKGEHFTVLQGNSFEQDARFPYAPWLDALRAFFVSRNPDDLRDLVVVFAPELVKLLPELTRILPDAQPSTALDPEAEKHRLFETVAQFLTRLATDTPLLIILEDIHWSDEISLDLLHFIARRGAQTPMALMVSYRREEISSHLARMLAQFDRERLAEEIVLPPLARPDVESMVGAIFSIKRPIKAEFLNLIMPLTEGNPFFIEEVLKSLMEQGDIFLADGRWERKPTRELRVPRTVQDAVQRHTEQLSAAARQVLTLAAVAGQRFDFALLQELSKVQESDLLRSIRELIAAQLVREESADEFAFRHALTREAVYATLLVRERRALHQKIGETLEWIHANALDAHPAELAYHFYQAGVWEKALQYSERAGEQARALYALPAAVNHLSRALDAAQKASLPPPLKSLLVRGQLYETLGEFEKARADLEMLLEFARASGDLHVEWQALLELGFLWAYRDYAQSSEYLQHALESARRLNDPASLAHSLNRVGNSFFSRGQLADAQAYFREALDIFRSLNDPRGIAETLDLLGTVSYLLGDWIKAPAYYEQALAIFRGLGDRRGLAQTLAVLPVRGEIDTEVQGAVHMGELLNAGENALRIARDLGWHSGEAQATIALARCLITIGEYTHAQELARQSVAITEEINHRIFLAVGNCTLGEVYLGIFAFVEAIPYLERARQSAQESGARIFNILATVALTGLYCEQNDLAHAEALLNTVLTPFNAGQSTHARRIWTARGELALAQSNAAYALQIAEQLIASARNIQTYGPHAIPRLSYLRGEALAVLGRLDEAAAELEAARDVARVQGRLPLLWRIHASLGKVYRALGRAADAQNELAAGRARVEELAQNVPEGSLRENYLHHAFARIPVAAAISPREKAKKEFGGLTEREREVAALIAQGKSNRKIGDALVITERTAERHVANIMSKLGFNSRTQIAAWAVEKRLTNRNEP